MEAREDACIHLALEGVASVSHASVPLLRHVTHLHQAWEDQQGTCFQRMELLKGGCLSSAISRRILDSSREEPSLPLAKRVKLDQVEGICQTGVSGEAWKVALDVSMGLLIMHQLGVAHLDIKPENILRDTTCACSPSCSVSACESRWVIADLGAATLVPPSPLQFVPPRKKGASDFLFCAPELYKHDQASTAADIFALGLSLWCMIMHVASPPRDTEVWNAIRDGRPFGPEVLVFLHPSQPSLRLFPTVSGASTRAPADGTVLHGAESIASCMNADSLQLLAGDASFLTCEPACDLLSGCEGETPVFSAVSTRPAAHATSSGSGRRAGAKLCVSFSENTTSETPSPPVPPPTESLLDRLHAPSSPLVTSWRDVPLPDPTEERLLLLVEMMLDPKPENRPTAEEILRIPGLHEACVARCMRDCASFQDIIALPTALAPPPQGLSSAAHPPFTSPLPLPEACREVYLSLRSLPVKAALPGAAVESASLSPCIAPPVPLTPMLETAGSQDPFAVHAIGSQPSGLGDTPCVITLQRGGAISAGPLVLRQTGMLSRGTRARSLSFPFDCPSLSSTPMLVSKHTPAHREASTPSCTPLPLFIPPRQSLGSVADTPTIIPPLEQRPSPMPSPEQEGSGRPVKRSNAFLRLLVEDEEQEQS